MKERRLTVGEVDAFAQYLQDEERELGTIEKYLRDIRAFVAWAENREISKELAASWKEHLKSKGYSPETINSKLSALNKYLAFLGHGDCRVKYLKIQRRLFRSTERELTKEEYVRLLETANALGKTRLSLLMETICATGIRVSEVKYITVQGIPPQPAAPVCPDVLPYLQGCGQAGRCFRTFQHRNYANLSDLHRCGARPAAGTTESYILASK